MNLFRNLLFWIVLALVGALVAQLLVQDPGHVLVRYGGYDYTMTVVDALLMGVAGIALLWVLWKGLSLPLSALRRHRKKHARARLVEGLEALHHGHWARAEKALSQAAQPQRVGRNEVASIAHLAAARAADARGDDAAVTRHLDALAAERPLDAAIARAQRQLAAGAFESALDTLDAAPQPLPPHGLALRAQALAALGRSGEAYGLLGALRQQQALPAAELARLESRWAEAGLREAADANVLADRWEALPKPLRSDPAAVAAYAERAAALRWDEAATRSVEQALDANWSDALASLYGRLPVGRLEARQSNAERWLQQHPASPALLLTLARLLRAQRRWPQAEGYLHRAIAQGAGSEGWEELGHGFAEAGDETLARLSYANALRSARDEAIVELPGRDLRQRIFDEAAIEERDEHGMPRLRG